MKTVVIVFVPADAKPEDFAKRMHDCMAVLEEFRIAEDHKPNVQTEAPPFWTWFIDNPRPTPSAPLL